ncbi:MAG: cell envelope integrity protein TolA [Akkermansiaceae bacterium]|nr:cell envelope integrity protein TolA [Akkermansiaceae bacterium]MCP5546353.1 cell envelope integrity protein TolA [Akkermansiaceae bacterium]
MKSRILLGFAAIGCLSLASCYPWPENNGKKKQEEVKKEPTLEELKKQKEDEARKKAEEDLKKKAEENKNEVGPEGATAGGGTTTPGPDPQPEPKSHGGDYPFANKVPGKEGFVFSPYNNKVVDVRDIPSGTLVMDPTYPPSEKKYFRVP